MTNPATFLESYEQDLDRQNVERRAEPGPYCDAGEMDDRDPFDGSGGGFSIWDWLE